MTENDAKTKWCPFTRTMASLPENDSSITSINRAGQEDEAPALPQIVCCIASECMAWRWARDVREVSSLDRRPGFCGLAGVPGL